jgi:hypothetical protein
VMQVIGAERGMQPQQLVGDSQHVP